MNKFLVIGGYLLGCAHAGLGILAGGGALASILIWLIVTALLFFLIHSIE